MCRALFTTPVLAGLLGCGQSAEGFLGDVAVLFTIPRGKAAAARNRRPSQACMSYAASAPLLLYNRIVELAQVAADSMQATAQMRKDFYGTTDDDDDGYGESSEERESSYHTETCTSQSTSAVSAGDIHTPDLYPLESGNAAAPEEVRCTCTVSSTALSSAAQVNQMGMRQLQEEWATTVLRIQSLSAEFGTRTAMKKKLVSGTNDVNRDLLLKVSSCSAVL